MSRSNVNLGTLTLQIRGDRFTFAYRAPAVPGTGASGGVQVVYNTVSRRVEMVELSASRTQRRFQGSDLEQVRGNWGFRMELLPAQMQQQFRQQIARMNENIQEVYTFSVSDFCNNVPYMGRNPVAFQDYMQLAQQASATAAASLLAIDTARVGLFFPVNQAMYQQLANLCTRPDSLGGNLQEP